MKKEWILMYDNNKKYKIYKTEKGGYAICDSNKMYGYCVDIITANILVKGLEEYDRQ